LSRRAPSESGASSAILEDLEDIYLADKALEDLRAGRSRTYTLDEVAVELDLDG